MSKEILGVQIVDGVIAIELVDGSVITVSDDAIYREMMDQFAELVEEGKEND